MCAPIIILTGSPGAGKSTVASLLAERFDPSAVVAGDFFLDALRTGKIPPWEPASQEQNTAIIGVTVRTAAGYADRGWTTILEGILGPWFLPLIGEATAGIDVHYFVLAAPLAVCIERVENRGPGIGADVVAKMHREFERAALDPTNVVDADRATEEITDDILGRIDQRIAML